MADNARDKFWRQAIGAAGKKISLLRDKQLNSNLDYACGSLADAYRMGVEEAQTEIVARLRLLQGKLTAAPSPVTQPDSGAT